MGNSEIRDTGNIPLLCVSPRSHDLFAEDTPAECLIILRAFPRMENFHPLSSTHLVGTELNIPPLSSQRIRGRLEKLGCGAVQLNWGRCW
jgi:hypothetical protein